MGIVTYNGISSDSLGLVIEAYPKKTFPQRDVDFIHIPGRSGDLVMDNKSYQNVSLEYDIAFVLRDLQRLPNNQDTSYSDGVSRIGYWLHSANGYARLEDTYDPEVYRMAAYSESVDLENILMKAGRATINFNAKPQRWLKSGEIWKQFSTWLLSHSSTSPLPGTIYNETNFPSKPFIKIRIIGAKMTHQSNPLPVEVNLSIGSRSIIIDTRSIPRKDGTLIRYESTGVSEIPAEEVVLYIDCELEDVYSENNEFNPNSYIRLTNGFPIINSEEIVNVTSVSPPDEENYQVDVEIQGRWWTL